MPDWINPLQGSSIHQGFRPASNPGHQGLDLGFDDRSPMGAPIVAPRDGVVVYISPNEAAGGNVTNINHDDGYQTRYDHQSEFDVVLGQTVVQGQVIGLVGATGAVTGPHLHYEIHHPVGNPIDPTPFLGVWAPAPIPIPPKGTPDMNWIVPGPPNPKTKETPYYWCHDSVRSYIDKEGTLGFIKKTLVDAAQPLYTQTAPVDQDFLDCFTIVGDDYKP